MLAFSIRGLLARMGINMKLVTVDVLQEGDKLAKDVLLEDYTVILSKGTEIKEAYIDKLRELEIVTVYIEDEEDEVEDKDVEVEKEDGKQSKRISIEEVTILRSEVEDKIKNKVKDILELHVYQHNEGLKKITEAATNIISDILKTDEVLERVYDVRERGSDIYEHTLSTCTIATIVALKLNLLEKEVYDISVSSLLHDLGLRYLIVKYEDQDINLLEKNDQEEYKKHPIYGYTALKNESWITNEAKEIILNHHEHLDGKGYPLGTSKISKSCEILGVCDEFDEMICGIGKARVRVHEAINTIRNYSGIWYDAEVVDAFLSLIAVYPVGSKVVTNDGRKAVVMKQNQHFPERPVLRIVGGFDGEEMREDEIIDLIKETKVVIQDVIK